MFLLNLICADPSTPQTARALSPAGVPVKGRAGSEDLRCQTGSGPPPRAPHLDLRVLLLQRNHLPLQSHQPSSPACVLTGTLAFVSNLWRCSLSACDHFLRNDRKKNTKTFIRSRLGLLVKRASPGDSRRRAPALLLLAPRGRSAASLLFALPSCSVPEVQTQPTHCNTSPVTAGRWRGWKRIPSKQHCLPHPSQLPPAAQRHGFIPLG